ncbi:MULTISPECIES: septum formation family protein [unclassified Streptomyces]|uniref:septum formation family protein n=1 Tax=unclassified Streptomyces TaxID=2593676 RepID=UPI000F6C99AE|nr:MULTISPECIES: septum formation family protein [unclassified Streptomyces]AZM64734.1 hypothetical protein DLM49_23090 [Streptomyces sp. WAC 01438]RSM97438.1 hypothetical protein DMA10_11650 [Streptomyces sp. WAC 01420]
MVGSLRSLPSLRDISVVVALLAVGAVGCSEMSESAKEGAKKAARQRLVHSLDLGDCFNANSRTEKETYSVEVVPCDEAHQGQVVGEFEIDDKEEGKYPGPDGLSALVDDRCAAEAQKYAPDTWALPKGVTLFHYTPTEEGWATGDRAVTCSYTAENGTMSGPVGTAKSLDPRQAAYLKGSNGVYEALWVHQPETDSVEDDLSGYKAQAKAVAAALEEHVQGLGAIEGAEVGKLRSGLTKAVGHWKKAAGARDVDAFYAAYDPALTGIDPDKSVTAREELGLATTVPAEDAEVWAAG